MAAEDSILDLGELTDEKLEELSYRELQTWAKSFGIPANRRAVELTAGLRGLRDGGSMQTPSKRIQKAVPPSTVAARRTDVVTATMTTRKKAKESAAVVEEEEDGGDIGLGAGRVLYADEATPVKMSANTSTSEAAERKKGKTPIRSAKKVSALRSARKSSLNARKGSVLQKTPDMEETPPSLLIIIAVVAALLAVVAAVNLATSDEINWASFVPGLDELMSSATREGSRMSASSAPAANTHVHDEA